MIADRIKLLRLRWKNQDYNLFADLLFMLLAISVLAVPNLISNKAAPILLFIGFIAYVYLRKKLSINWLALLWGVLFCGYVLLSRLWVPETRGYSMEFNNLVWSMGISVAVIHYITAFRVDFRKLALMMMVCFAILLINSLFTGSLNAKDMRLSIGINENRLGRIASTIGFFVLVYGLQTKSRRLLTLFVPILIMVFLSGSRKALLALAFYFALSLFIGQDRRSLMKRLLLILGLALITAALIFKVDTLYRIIGHRVEQMFSYLLSGESTDESMLSRGKMIAQAWDAFKSAPVLGHGMHSFSFITYYKSYSHNNYVELLSGLGLIGFLLYYVPLLAFIRTGFSRLKHSTLEVPFALGLLVSSLLLDVANVSYISMIDHFFFGIAIGMILAADPYGIKASAESFSGDASLKMPPKAKQNNATKRQVNKRRSRLMHVLNWRKWVDFLDNRRFFNRISDEAYLRLMYRARIGRPLHLNKPLAYTEKLQWLKLHDRSEKYTTMVDKYRVRDYVAKTIGEEHLFPVLGTWETAEQIDFDALPEQFVLKCNHSSGDVIVCRDKSRFDRDQARRQLQKTLQKDYYFAGREWPYKNVKRMIYAEQFMVDESGYELKDYKFFCFNGEPRMLYVASDRGKQGEEVKFDFFDLDWNHLPFVNGHPHAKREIPRPQALDEMLRLSRKLAQGFRHVRVDLYDINGQVYFGEMTFFHMSGMARFEPDEWDYTIGAWLDLPAQHQAAEQVK